MRLDQRKKKILNILKAAAKRFSGKGYLETSMDEVAEAAGITKGAIYHYFSRKEEILFGVLDNYMNFILENLEQKLETIESNSEKVRFIILRHLEIYTKNIHEAKILLNEAHNLPPKYFKLIAEKERIYYRIVADNLLKYLNVELSKDTLIGITFILFGMCNWIYSWYNPKKGLKPEQLADLIYRIFTKGIDKLG